MLSFHMVHLVLLFVLQRRCKLRERYKLDFDYYSREVDNLKEKATADPAKLARKEAKLIAAEATLEGFSG